MNARMIVVGVVAIILAGSWAVAQTLPGDPKQGVLFSPMHGWSDRLSEQQMRDVLSYIRTFAPFNAVS